MREKLSPVTLLKCDSVVLGSHVNYSRGENSEHDKYW